MSKYCYMGFRETLKDELKYQGILVKELADKTGIPKGTIDHYLAEKNTEPIAENAVKIAKALNVSVEYLVTGSNQETQNKDFHYSPQIRQIIKKLEQMNEKQLHMIQEIITVIEKEMP